MNTSKVSFGILSDYSIAFDTINHLALSEKLHKLNFSVQALKLICSYVSEQKRFHQVDDKSSSIRLNNFVEPQSSIFYPLPLPTYTESIQQRISPAIPYNMMMIPPCRNVQTQKNLKRSIEELESDIETVHHGLKITVQFS